MVSTKTFHERGWVLTKLVGTIIIIFYNFHRILFLLIFLQPFKKVTNTHSSLMSSTQTGGRLDLAQGLQVANP